MSQRDYNEGVKDGQNNTYKSNSAVDVLMGAVLPGTPPAGNSKDYDDGYKDGKKDR